MNRAISSLALLKVNWDNANHRIDFIESFVPFVVTLINRRNYKTLSVSTVCKDFESEYGLQIPYHPMLAILSRVMRGGYIRKGKRGNYIPIKDKVVADDFTDIALEQGRKYKRVLDTFLQFSDQVYGEKLSESEAEGIFISFLRDHDLDILFVNQELETLLPEATASITQRYLINSFITRAHESDPEMFAFIVDISVGHVIANTLLYRDFDKYQGNLLECNFYLDIGFLFNVVGINGVEKKEAYTDFVRLLASQRAYLFVFRHTFDEFMGILEGCMHWVESAYFDPLKASRAAIYFVENSFSSSDIEQFILSVPSRLSELGIEIADPPAPRESEFYQIDEEQLTTTIVDIYKGGKGYFDEYEKEFTVYRDVRSISAVCKLRKGCRPITLQDAKHVFVTTNSALALASRVFESQSTEAKFFFIPAALTDVFVGTLVWIQSPMKVTTGLNEKRLIANSYASLQPSRAMVKKLTETADHLKNTGVITIQDVTILKQSRLARNLLQEETLGDPNRFTDKTAIEILDEIRSGIRREEVDRLQEDRRGFQDQERALSEQLEQERLRAYDAEQMHNQSQAELQRVLHTKSEIEKRIETTADRITSLVIGAYYVISGVIIAVAVTFQLFPSVFGTSKVLRIVLITLAAVLSAASLATGAKFKDTGQALRLRLKHRIVAFLKGTH